MLLFWHSSNMQDFWLCVGLRRYCLFQVYDDPVDFGSELQVVWCTAAPDQVNKVISHCNLRQSESSNWWVSENLTNYTSSSQPVPIPVSTSIKFFREPLPTITSVFPHLPWRLQLYLLLELAVMKFFILLKASKRDPSNVKILRDSFINYKVSC